MEKQNHLLIGETAKLLGLTPETLRFFEKERIIKSNKGENNYRFYDDWEINYLIEYKKYRGYGFSKNKAREILHEYSYYDFLEAFEENGKELQKKMTYLKMLIKKNDETVENTKNLKNKIGKFQFVDISDMYYYKFRYNNQYFYNKDNESLYRHWSENMPLVEPILLITSPNEKDYFCGLAVSKENREQLNLPINKNVLFKAGGRHVNTVIVAGNKNTFSTDLLKPVYEFICESGYQVNGHIVGYYRARVQGEEYKEYERYIELYVPVVEK